MGLLRDCTTSPINRFAAQSKIHFNLENYLIHLLLFLLYFLLYFFIRAKIQLRYDIDITYRHYNITLVLLGDLQY